MFVFLLLFGLVLLKTSEVFIVANEVGRMNSLPNIAIKWYVYVGHHVMIFTHVHFVEFTSESPGLLNS